MFLVAIQRGMSSLFAFRCVPSCFRAIFAVGGVTGGVDLDCCVGFRDRLRLSELSLFVFFFSPLLAAGSFHCYRLCRGLVVMLVTGSMAMLLVGVPWRNCAGQLGFFFRGRWELPGEMGCGGGPWVLALLRTEALIFYYKEKKIATATWRKGETEGD